MFKIKIDDDGYLLSPTHQTWTREVEVSEEDYNKTLTIPFDKDWRYVDGQLILEENMSDASLKHRRAKECFSIIDNRSQMWYNHLTAKQKEELEAWYQAWLDVTETKVIPVKPEWL